MKHLFSVVPREDRLRVSAVAWILSPVNSRKEKNMGQRKQNKKADQQVSTPPGQEHTCKYPDKGYPCRIRLTLDLKPSCLENKAAISEKRETAQRIYE